MALRGIGGGKTVELGIASGLRITTLRRDFAADLLQEQYGEIFDSS
jgi:hypothetical protein